MENLKTEWNIDMFTSFIPTWNSDTGFNFTIRNGDGNLKSVLGLSVGKPPPLYIPFFKKRKTFFLFYQSWRKVTEELQSI